MFFPEYKFTEEWPLKSDKSLIPPKLFENLKRNKEDLEWGYVVSSPSGISKIYLLGLEFDVRDDDFEKQVKKLYSSFYNFEQKLMDLIYLFSRQQMYFKVEVERHLANLSLFDGKSRNYLPVKDLVSDVSIKPGPFKLYK